MILDVPTKFYENAITVCQFNCVIFVTTYFHSLIFQGTLERLHFDRFVFHHFFIKFFGI